MKLLVGRGNIGQEYLKTRHNVGFMILDQLASALNSNFVAQSKFKSMVSKVNFRNLSFYMLKPQTYMNLSGQAVSLFANYYKIPLEDIIIIYDEVSLPFAKIKMKIGGSSDGHNGIRSIDQSLNSKEYYRLKIGIDRDDRIELSQYVLSNFNRSELSIIQDRVFNEILFNLDKIIDKSYI